jgi:glycosyltransferase involved in cell wall biosynthesis
LARHDVTIYSPFSAALLRRSVGRVGGAERQMLMLARGLVNLGHDVALVVYPVPDPVPDLDPRLTIVERADHAGSEGPLLGNLREGIHVARALSAADGKVVVVRTGNPVVGFIAIYCRLRRRKFVFSSASDVDFLPRPGVSRVQSALYKFGVRRADAVVVQSARQVELAQRAFPRTKRLIRVPSFADEAPPIGDVPAPTAFVWAGRLIDLKRPMLYAELAAAVPEARFVIVPHISGSSPASQLNTFSALERAVAETPNLELSESLPHTEMMKAIAGAVAIVNTSSFEGMPNTFLEAWSQGVPALTLAVDPDGIIAANRLGVSADGSWERFVAGARELWARRFERSDVAERTRAYVSTAHSHDVVAGQWSELLENLGAFDEKSSRRPGPCAS